MPETLPAIDLLGVNLHAVTEHECATHVANSWNARKGGWIHTINLDHLRRMTSGSFFSGSRPTADLAVADGLPLVWASRIQGKPLPERVAGSDLIRSLVAEAASQGKRVFFLGGNPGTAIEAAETLQLESPGFINCGCACPDNGFESDPETMRALTDQLIAAKPDLVFVAVGAPKSERLIQFWRRKVDSAWWIGVGISFSFVAGEIHRAPRWMQVSCLEWMHRLFQEPRRLCKRYLVHGVPFAAYLFASSLKRRVFSVPSKWRGNVAEATRPVAYMSNTAGTASAGDIEQPSAEATRVTPSRSAEERVDVP